MATSRIHARRGFWGRAFESLGQKRRLFGGPSGRVWRPHTSGGPLSRPLRQVCSKLNPADGMRSKAWFVGSTTSFSGNGERASSNATVRPHVSMALDCGAFTSPMAVIFIGCGPSFGLQKGLVPGGIRH